MSDETLDNGSKGVIQEKGEQKEVSTMLYIKVFAFGIDQTYAVRKGLIPVSAFTMEHTKAERLDGSPVRLVKDPSLKSYRVITFS